jgi:hypothetical protein
MHHLFWIHVPGTIGTERTQYSKVTPIIVFFQKKGRASYLTAEITGSAFYLFFKSQKTKQSQTISRNCFSLGSPLKTIPSSGTSVAVKGFLFDHRDSVYPVVVINLETSGIGTVDHITDGAKALLPSIGNFLLLRNCGFRLRICIDTQIFLCNLVQHIFIQPAFLSISGFPEHLNDMESPLTFALFVDPFYIHVHEPVCCKEAGEDIRLPDGKRNDRLVICFMQKCPDSF